MDSEIADASGNVNKHASALIDVRIASQVP
jgi:hypothetical protein